MTERRTALIVAVPGAAPAVEPWLERTGRAKPSTGVPVHITLLFPFVPAVRIDPALVEKLGELFASFPSFRFVLRRAERFPEVLYLAPEPAEPFVRLTEAIAARYPEHPPYQGAFDTIVPHLTVAQGESRVLDEAEADVSRALPLEAAAAEVVLLEEVVADWGRWEPRARLALNRGSLRRRGRSGG
jgi:2'-5' RNA ligase